MILYVFINQGRCKAGEMEINLGNCIESEGINPKDVTIKVGKEALKVIVKVNNLLK